MATKNIKTAVDLDSEETALLAKLAAIKEKKLAAETARLDKIAETVNGLPAMLGVTNFADVINLIKQVEKGTLGKLATSARAYVKLTEENKTAIMARLVAGGPANQVSVLANEFGVSSGTIYNLKKGQSVAAAS